MAHVRQADGRADGGAPRRAGDLSDGLAVVQHELATPEHRVRVVDDEAHQPATRPARSKPFAMVLERPPTEEVDVGRLPLVGRACRDPSRRPALPRPGCSPASARVRTRGSPSPGATTRSRSSPHSPPPARLPRPSARRTRPWRTRPARAAPSPARRRRSSGSRARSPLPAGSRGWSQTGSRRRSGRRPSACRAESETTAPSPRARRTTRSRHGSASGSASEGSAGSSPGRARWWPSCSPAGTRREQSGSRSGRTRRLPWR